MNFNLLKMHIYTQGIKFDLIMTFDLGKCHKGLTHLEVQVPTAKSKPQTLMNACAKN